MTTVQINFIWILLLSTMVMHGLNMYISKRMGLIASAQYTFKVHAPMYTIVWLVEPYNIFLLLMATLSMCMSILQFMEVTKVPIVVKIGLPTLKRFSTQSGFVAIMLVTLAIITRYVG